MPRAAAAADNFDEAIKELAPAGMSMASKVCFGANAVFASIIPAYLYYSNFFGVELSYYYVYLAVMVVCLVLLYLSYVKVASDEFGRVMERKKRFGEEATEKAGRSEAAAYSLFMNNLIFLGGVALLSFVVMPRLSFNIPAYVQYALSSILSALFTFCCGYDYI